ncbi:MAG: hypothetical protein IIC95_07745 [Chloroflexi bacterium]|nr:hypothetical protein [Chloroflexota bacterium]
MDGVRPDGPQFVLINSISRSGGTFLKALFDRLPGVLTFPIEFPTAAGRSVDFLTSEQFGRLGGYREWADATGLSYFLTQFGNRPYGRMFGRPQRPGEPDVSFDYGEFSRIVGGSFAGFGNVREAYLASWRTFASCITVDGAPTAWAADDFPMHALVNHYATDVTREFSILDRNAAPVCRLYLVHVVRDPLENVASLQQHWVSVGRHRGFAAMALARWELYLYAALRNKTLYPDRCDVVLYDADVANVARSFAASPVPLLQTAAGSDMRPTVLGLPLQGQSYKERRGGGVAERYDYASRFSPDDLAGLERGRERIYRFLGISSLAEVASGYQPSAGFQELVDLSPEVFEGLLRSAGDTFTFAVSEHLDFDRNALRHVRQLGLSGLARRLARSVVGPKRFRR